MNIEAQCRKEGEEGESKDESIFGQPPNVDRIPILPSSHHHSRRKEGEDNQGSESYLMFEMREMVSS